MCNIDDANIIDSTLRKHSISTIRAARPSPTVLSEVEKYLTSSDPEQKILAMLEHRKDKFRGKNLNQVEQVGWYGRGEIDMMLRLQAHLHTVQNEQRLQVHISKDEETNRVLDCKNFDEGSIQVIIAELPCLKGERSQRQKSRPQPVPSPVD